jgi:hypothetical protein
MVDTGRQLGESPPAAEPRHRFTAVAHRGTAGRRRRMVGRRWFTVVVLGALSTSSVVLALGVVGPAPSVSASLPSRFERPVTHSIRSSHSHRGTSVSVAASPTTTTTQATSPTSVAPTQTPAPPSVQPASSVSVTSLVGQVEATGIEPGPNWTWSAGDTAQCGVIAGSGAATGCTSWGSGMEKTVFAGSPSLALVAHELANAETESDAVPSLLGQVAAVAASTSWSPTDAVASCLVEHFLGFQDDAAGPWQCPAALATFVAENIHDTVVTTRVTATCGTTSGISSTLTFTASAGTLTVTTPANDGPPQTVTAGTPVTVSGIGAFTAVDQGGTVGETGACEG